MGTLCSQLFKTRITKTMSLQLQHPLLYLSSPTLIALLPANPAMQQQALCTRLSVCLSPDVCASECVQGALIKQTLQQTAEQTDEQLQQHRGAPKLSTSPPPTKPVSLIDESCDQHQVVKIQFISSRCLLPARCGKAAGAAHDDHMLNVFTGVQNSLSPSCQARPLK